VTVGAARTPLALFVELLGSYAAAGVVVAAFGQGDGPAPSFVAVTVVVIGSWTLARALQMTDFDQDAMRLIGVLASFVVLFAVARIEYAPDEWIWELGWFAGLFTDFTDTVQPNAHVIAGMVALAPMWFRGVVRGQAAIEFESVLTSASVGMLAVIIAALATPDTREAMSWGAYALLYAATALVALAVYQAPEPDVSLGSFARRWTSAGVLLAGVVVGVALFTAALDPDAFGVLAPIGEPLQFVGSALGTYVLSPILYVISLPFRALFWLMGQIIPDPDPPQPQEPQVLEDQEREPREDRSTLGFRIFWWAVGITAGVVVLAIATLLLWSAFRRFAKTRERDPRERRESIEASSSLASDFGDLVGAIARRFRRARRAPHAVQIRRLYFEMLEAAESRGVPRPPAATPLQFAPSLDAHFRSAVPSSISRAFAESRYGDVAIDAGVVRELRSAWSALRGSTDFTAPHT
jgi:hypothetical protein